MLDVGTKVPRDRVEKRDYWLSVLRQWRQSGLSQVDFCAQHGLCIRGFRRWRTRLGSEVAHSLAGPAASEAAAFLPLQLVGERGEVEVMLAQGDRMRLSGTYAETLVASLIRRLSC